MTTSQQPVCTRREVLQTAAAATLAAGLRPAAAAQAPPKTPRVDAHLHCFAGAGSAQFPYHERAPYKPEQPATPEHLLDCMRQAEVDFAVVVHPEPYQDDHRYLEHCLAVGSGKLKGTLLLFADRAGSLDKLPDLSKLPIVAMRVHAYAPIGCRPSASRSCGVCGNWRATTAWRCSCTSSRATPPASSR